MSISASTPRISIIVAVFNGAKTLPKLLDSLNSQTYQNLELILIDGGSTDGTVELIKMHSSQISYWISEPDDGIYEAWNKGLAQAHGEWICFLGADDYLWGNDVFERMLPFLGTSGLVYGCIAVLTQDGRVLYTVGEPWETAQPKLRDIMSVPHPGMLHHKSWFKKYGMFDTSFRIAGDYEMLLRGRMNEKAVFVPGMIVVGMALGGISSTSENALRQLQEVRRAQRKWGITMPGRRYLWAYTRVKMRCVLQRVFGKNITYHLLDLGRKLLNKPPHWTKL